MRDDEVEGVELQVVAFGERFLYKQIREGKNRRDKFESEGATECLSGPTEGVIRAYSFRRRDESSQWDAWLIQGTKGTPQQPDPGIPGGRIPIRVHFEEEQTDSEEDEAAPEAADMVFKRLRIIPKMLHKYGYTDGCGECRHKRCPGKIQRPLKFVQEPKSPAFICGFMIIS